ncbi:MAG: cyclase family protein [Phycisphaerales bacterium JB037]
MPTVYDISPPITADLAVFPGDTPPSREILLDMHRGDHLTLSTLHATVHLGAHADGVNHYAADGPAIDELKLHHYLGPCRVIDVSAARGERIALGDVPDGSPFDQPRILFFTGSQPDKNTFNQDFKGLEPDLIEALAGAGVMTVGVDTPSVDTATTKELIAHARCRKARIAIIEGLVLDAVPPGVYELIALPLKLVGFDASPVRAVLRELPA